MYQENFNKKIKNTGLLTDYHKLFVFPHSCSVIKNLYKSNNRKLLISGDSQMIPLIPILCTIFEELYYFDSRTDKSFKRILGNVNFDDILIEIFNRDLDYYVINNLK